MKTQKVLFVFLFFITYFTCFGQENNIYSIGKIPEMSSFLNINDIEKQMLPMFEEINFSSDSLNQNGKFKKDFIHNRSRVFMNSYTDGKANPRDTSFHSGLPVPCTCTINHDSIFVYMNFGFFGGFGFDIIIAGNQFQSHFFEYTDDVKPYKLSIKDTVFSKYIKVDNVSQSLIFNEKPTFSIGQQITGYLTFTSSTYIEQPIQNNVGNKFIDGYLYFTCKTMQRTLFDQLMFERK